MNKITLLLITLAVIVLSSCGGKVDRPAPVLTDDQIRENQASFDAPLVPAGGNVGGVEHYICPNGHSGSSAQGSCATCGTALVHNQAFHNQTPGTTPSPEGEPPQNALGVWHYTCPNGHAGGSGSATACPECGTVLVHNTVYHNGDQPAAANDLSGAIPTVAPPAGATPAPATPEPAQNAAGVWHYTCPNGHSGGSGSATACSECGTTLVHNTTYHN